MKIKDIPSYFEVCGIPHRVIFEDHDHTDNKSGLYNPASATITLYRYSYGRKLTEEVMYNTFLHELVHCVFDAVEEFSLSNNEQLVQNMANVLNTIITTVKYERDEDTSHQD